MPPGRLHDEGNVKQLNQIMLIEEGLCKGILTKVIIDSHV